MDKQEQLRQEMIKIVESEEVRLLLEEDLRFWDFEALTDRGIIRSYKIDYDSLSLNPMGGFSMDVYINNDTKYRYATGVIMDSRTGKFRMVGGSRSHDLQILLERGK